MVRLIELFIVFLFSLQHCQGQLLVDTIYSGRSRDTDLSGSLNKSILDNIKNMDLCRNKPSKNLTGIHPRSNIPFLLNLYSEKRLKNRILKDFEVLIYTSICGNHEFIEETYILEMFYENENKAKECIKALNKLSDYFEYIKKHDVLEDKNEFVAPIIIWNFFFKRKGNVIYLFHKALPLDDDFSTIQPLKFKFFNLIDILYEHNNK